MNRMLFDRDGGLRNGWWVALFLAAMVLLGKGASLLPLGAWVRQAGWSRSVLEPMTFLITLAATWVCTAARKEPLASVGFQLDRRWAREAAWGVLLGAAIMLLAAGLLVAVGGVRFELSPTRSLKALSYGLYLFTCVALFEETLFRGFLFQRMLAGLGEWPTQIILALLFAFVHWGNPGMHGATRVWATVDIALAAIFLGLAYLRTRSLALAVGIHLGWNWTQGHILGFGVSGTSADGWLRPVFQGRPEWVSGGAFGLEASIFGVVAVLLGIALLWRWRGSAVAGEGA